MEGFEEEKVILRMIKRGEKLTIESKSELEDMPEIVEALEVYVSQLQEYVERQHLQIQTREELMKTLQVQNDAFGKAMKDGLVDEMIEKKMLLNKIKESVDKVDMATISKEEIAKLNNALVISYEQIKARRELNKRKGATTNKGSGA